MHLPPDEGAGHPRPSLIFDDRIWKGRIGPEGEPISGTSDQWWDWLSELDRLRKSNPGAWSDSDRERAGALVLTALRFCRTDGSSVFGPAGEPPDRVRLLRRWAEALADPGLARVSRWWFDRRGARGADGPPPLPAFGHRSHPLAMLRADWLADGDFVAIDGRVPLPHTSLEVQAAGKMILGARWTAGDGASGRAKGFEHASGPLADWTEWKFRVGSSWVARTAVFLRGRRMALLADEWHRAEGSVGTRIEIPAGIAANPLEGTRALALKRPGVSARVMPLGLPALPYPTERGSFAVEDGALIVRQSVEARRAWVPLFLSWDRERNRRPASWRVLTVAERSKVTRPGVAFAARVSWGPGDGLVIYRSLAKPALRSFLGYQTSARFVVGVLKETGFVVPLLKID